MQGSAGRCRAGHAHTETDGYLTDASGQLERDQPFINEVAKQLLADVRAACQLNTNRGANPKSSDTNGNSSSSAHYMDHPREGHCT